MSERDNGIDADCIGSEQDLRALHAPPSDLVKKKCVDRLDRHCRDFIALSPFLVLGTANAAGKADVSPRGDPPGFVQVLDDRTVAVPDRPGNHRTDTLHNLFDRPEIAMLALVPGDDRALELRGTARITDAPGVLAAMEVHGKVPKAAVVVDVVHVDRGEAAEPSDDVVGDHHGVRLADAGGVRDVGERRDRCLRPRPGA